MLMLMGSLVNGIEYGKGSATSKQEAKNLASRAAWNELKREHPNADI